MSGKHRGKARKQRMSAKDERKGRRQSTQGHGVPRSERSERAAAPAYCHAAVPRAVCLNPYPLTPTPYPLNPEPAYCHAAVPRAVGCDPPEKRGSPLGSPALSARPPSLSPRPALATQHIDAHICMRTIHHVACAPFIMFVAAHSSCSWQHTGDMKAQE